MIDVGPMTLAQAEQLFDSKIARRAMAQAMNAATSKAKNAQAAAVSKTYTVQRLAFKKTVILRRAKPKNLQSALVSVSRITPITIHKPKQDERGLVVAVKRGQPKVIPHAFLALFSRGRHLGGAKRLPGVQAPRTRRLIRRGPRKGQVVKRDALKQLYGATLAHLADNPEVVEAVRRKMGEFLSESFEQKLQRLVERAIAKSKAA